jgi:hypothetical protein
MAEETEREFTKLEIGGKEYSLIYDFDSIVTAEEATNMALLINVDYRRASVARVRAMLFALMLTAHPDIKLKEISKLIVPVNIPSICVAINAAWMDIRSADERDEKEGKAEQSAEEAA